MATLSELIKEKESLPPGELYYKIIKGKPYPYHQYFKDGKWYTKAVKKSEFEELRNKINRRKEIERKIKEIRDKEKTVILSKNAVSLTGSVMSGNIPVASFINGELVDINEDLAPLIIKRTHSLIKFLELRVIDISRTNARLLKKALDINVDEDYKIPLYSYALSVNDDYWFRPKNSKTKYQDIEFDNDEFFDLSLKGNTTFFPLKGKITPEITTTGSFEKGWRLIDGEWWLYKVGNKKQLFSELFCYQFARLIGLKTATYEYEYGFIRSKNFADKYNFEPMASLAGDNDNYDYVFSILYDINKQIAKDYLKLIFFDTVIYNIDRHNENTGLLRERGTGKTISLAPNFDNNLALISTVDSLKDPKKDKFIDLFINFINKNDNVKKLIKSVHIPPIYLSDISICAQNVPIKIEEIDDLIQKVYQRYQYLQDVIKETK